MVVGALAAILALAGGVFLGRKVIEGRAPKQSPRAAQNSRFHEPLTDVSIAVPANWTRLRSRDTEVRLLVAADPSTSLLLRVTKTGLDAVTNRSLPVVKQYTDSLLRQDTRAKQLTAPAAIDLGGLPGWRYRYTYSAADGSSGAHVHYFLFKNGRMIQLVFQASPADRLDASEPTFDRIAGTFRGVG
ncbi:MAG: hypothetical protein QOI48_2849 [Solirubrobacteraceae bacterium]|jgi:hypothetical protein|nr:hypothetical protein [Solirubrobacteraceae bacterium]